MAPERIEDLFRKFVDQSITGEEKQELFKAVSESGDEALSQLLETAWQEQLPLQQMPEQMSARIREEMFNAPVVQGGLYRERSTYWIKMAAAASILIAFALAAYFMMPANRQAIAKAVPGSAKTGSSGTGSKNKAVLTLGDGSEILLDDASKGVLAEEANATVDKLSDGSIRYRPGQASATVVYNTLRTPHGGQYELTLPDGSKVWLNALSSLRFPTAFSGKERRVQISGEAYFEIRPVYDERKKKLPFIVDVISAKGTSEVEVLGTRFNIKAYDDEEQARTSLLEGSVRITKGGDTRLMVPGQQARFGENNEIMMTDVVNMDEVMAWKNGYFQYEDADLQTVLRDAARWYNLEVHFAGAVPADRFTGRIPRTVSIDRLIKWMAWSDVAVTVEGNTLTVK